MKTKIIKSAFAEANNAVKGLLLKDKLSPFSKVLFDVVGPNVSLTATNGDAAVTWRFAGETAEDGALALPGASLAAFVSSFPEGAIDVKTESRRLKLSDDNSNTFKLAFGEAADFPSMMGPSSEDGAKAFRIPVDKLKEMIRKVRYAAATDDTRKSLCGVNFTCSEETLAMTATDGRRLSHVEAEGEADVSFDVTLTNKTIAILSQLLGAVGDEDDVAMMVDDRSVRITGSLWCMTALVAADKYPEWRKVVPESSENEARFLRKPFLEALERVALVPHSDEDGVKIAIADNVIAFSARSDGASASASVPATIFNDGAKETYHVNPRLVRDVLTAVDDDEITVGFSTGIKPLVFKCSVPFVGLIMPMRLA